MTGVTVLVDPWLEGDLVFAKQTWLYRGQKGALKDVKLDVAAIGAKADVILLSQVTSVSACHVSLLQLACVFYVTPSTQSEYMPRVSREHELYLLSTA